MTSDRFRDPSLGLRVLRMRNPSRVSDWIARRVDDVVFLDYVTVERQVTLELDLSDRTALPSLDGNVLLPVATFPVGRHTTITAADASGGLLARLTRDEERALVFGALIAVGELHVGDALSREDQERIYDIAVRRTEPPEALAGASPASQLLADTETFMADLRQAHISFNLVVVIPEPVDARLIVRLVYREPLTRPHRPKPTGGVRKPHFRRAAAALGRLVPCPGMTIRLDADEAAACRSYHVQARAPYDLHFERNSALTVVPAPVHARVEAVPSDAPSTSEIHYYWSGTHQIRQASVRARLVPVDKGLLRAAAWSTACIAVILLLGTLLAWSVPAASLHSADASSATALLLLAPAVLASALAGPAPHSLTTRVLFVTRFAVYVACTALFAAAVTIALRTGTSATRWTWTASAAVGLVVALFSTVRVFRVARRLRPNE